MRIKPETRYVRTRGARIAYQVTAKGSPDLVMVPGFASHLDLQWGDPSYARFLGRLAAASRLILYDKRGSGLSGQPRRPPALEHHVRDLLAVLDAAGARRPIVLGFSDGASAAVSFAAAHPERCAGLILVAPIVRGVSRGDVRLAEAFRRRGEVLEVWGSGKGLEVFAPSLAGSALHRRNFGLFERACLDPVVARAAIDAAADLDVADVLGAIRLPTLVLHRAGDIVPVEHGREIASRIPGARFVELEGADHLPYAGDANRMALEIEGFVAEVTEAPPTPPRPYLSVLFTDVVDSTSHLVRSGDAGWHETVASHDALTRAEVTSRGGTVVKSTGDGHLVTFHDSGSALRAAWAVREQVARLGIEVRAAVHAGPVGRLPDGDVVGVTVHACARMMGKALAGEILCSDVVRGAVADAGLRLDAQLPVELRGLPGQWPLYRLAGDAADDLDEEESHAHRPDSVADRLQVGFVRRAPAAARALARLTG